MNDVEQRAAAKHFADYWKGKGYEKGESQKFWLSLLTDVFGVKHAAEYIAFEDQVHLDHTSFIDGYIPETHVLIEQKGIGKDLKKPIRQSDGTLLKPIQQAQRYAAVLPYSQRPRWIIVCNFECFHVYDMEHPQSDPTEIWLKDLPAQYYLLEFLVRKEDLTLQKEMEISIQAGELVGRLYDAFLKEYKDPTNEHSLKSLNALCVRLVFCLYAEDAGIFGKRLMFHDYMQHNGLNKARQALIDLFRVLDTPVEERDPYMDDELAAFPYVNGGLFRDENIEIPRLNETIFDLLLNKASATFDWSDISPTIFGAVFESTLNPETRRSGGMHYTSIENIHKVIDPLFLNDLKVELEEIKALQVQRTREQRLRAFQNKLASLKFLDPACGSGNFLTESYLCLRKMENEVILLLQGDIHQMGLALLDNPIKVSIAQFYGIEINDFAATVAKTALWIAESQMMKRIEDIVHMTLDFLPLKSYVNIVEGNALRIDWNDVVPANELSYIMGNPPFVGKKEQTARQKQELINIFGKATKGVGDLDYVAGWYGVAANYINGTSIQVAFVSTNSITQGEQVAPLWTYMLQHGIQINFAYRTFQWDSEAKLKAHVHCVIISFSLIPASEKCIYTNGNKELVQNINAYLLNSPNVIIRNRAMPLCQVPSISYGAVAGSKQFVLSEEERESILNVEPNLEQFIRPFMGADELIKGKIRYCFWLKNASPTIIRNSHELMKRLSIIRMERETSTAEPTRKKADVPQLFFFEAQPNSEMIVIPKVSSENRRYVPISIVNPEIINNGSGLIIPESDKYLFGILISNVHMAWMRAVAGRMKSDYQYSKGIVYNTFPWPSPTNEQKTRIEQTAQEILDARALRPEASLADLYDDISMPPELRKAHQQNDRAVWEAYGKTWNIGKESDCVAYLMQLYQNMTALEDEKK